MLQNAFVGPCLRTFRHETRVIAAGEWRVGPHVIFYEAEGGSYAPAQEDLRHDWGRVAQNLLVWFVLLLTNGQVMKIETNISDP